MMYFFLVFMGVLAGILEWISIKHCFSGLHLSVAYSTLQAEPHQAFSMNIVVENRSWMPKMFLQVSGKIPVGFEVASMDWKERYVQSVLGTQKFSLSFFLMPFQKKEMEVPLVALRRGRYGAPTLYLTSGDYFGFTSKIKSFSLHLVLTVIPSTLSLQPFKEVVGGMLGETSVRRWVYEDPVLTGGFQEYTGREPMKSIAWSQSAKRGKYIVRQFDHTSQSHILVLLKMDCATSEQYELCFSAVRTVAEELERQRISWSFSSNGNIFSLESRSYFPDGLGKAHLYALNEALGRATYGTRQAFLETIRSFSDSYGECTQGILVLGIQKNGLSDKENAFLSQLGQGSVKYVQIAGDEE